VHTTSAAVHEAQCTEAIQQALVDKGLPPQEHIVDSAYIDAELLVTSQQQQGITLIGPTRPNTSWQAQEEDAYDVDQFDIDWAHQQVRCPQGKVSSGWKNTTDYTGQPMILVYFRQQDCAHCVVRERCTRSATERRLRFRPQAQYEALQAARQRYASEEGRLLYNRRAGIEGTLSQGVRAFDLRQTRYWGLAKTHLQHIATAAAINLDRLVAWLEEVPRALTRTSRFAALAPA
jgi:transposase